MLHVQQQNDIVTAVRQPFKIKRKNPKPEVLYNALAISNKTTNHIP